MKNFLKNLSQPDKDYEGYELGEASPLFKRLAWIIDYILTPGFALILALIFSIYIMLFNGEIIFGESWIDLL